MKTLLVIAMLACGVAKGQATVVNMPNTFCHQWVATFDLLHDDSVTLVIYDRLGTTLKSFYDKAPLIAGFYTCTWFTDSVAAGVYIARYLDAHTNVGQNILKACATSISHQDAISQTSIYPNPALDFITIPIHGMKSVLVTDMTGRSCLSVVTEEQILSISHLAPGSYAIHISGQAGELLISTKFTKDK